MRGDAAFSISKTQPARGPVSRPRRLDEVDRGIIVALQRNGREPFRRIAAGLGVSEATVRARYARLVDDDDPPGHRASRTRSAWASTRRRWWACARPAPPSRWPRRSPAGRRRATSSSPPGQFDVLVELLCVDRRHLLELTNRIRGLDGVTSTESFLYLELCKQVYEWGVRIP